MKSLFPTFARCCHQWRFAPLSFRVFTSPVRFESLLRILAAGVEQRLPLGPLLEAFAADEQGTQGRRIRRLAGLIEQGQSLPDALEQIPRVLPAESILAVRFGIHSGMLGRMLREEVMHCRAGEQSRLQFWRALLYAGSVGLLMSLVVAFLVIKILPTHRQILLEAGVSQLPTAWRPLLVWGWVARHSPYIALAAVVVAWGTWSGYLRKALRYGWLSWLTRPLFDLRSADVLRCLSLVAESGRPIPGALSTLARYHPDPSVRKKLLFVRNEVEQGADVWASLAAVRLVSPQEVPLLSQAAAVGNRGWVIGQLAARKRARVTRRVEFAAQLTQPLCVLLLGALTLCVALASFEPLTTLITAGASFW